MPYWGGVKMPEHFWLGWNRKKSVCPSYAYKLVAIGNHELCNLNLSLHDSQS